MGVMTGARNIPLVFGVPTQQAAATGGQQSTFVTPAQPAISGQSHFAPQFISQSEG